MCQADKRVSDGEIMVGMLEHAACGHLELAPSGKRTGRVPFEYVNIMKVHHTGHMVQGAQPRLVPDSGDIDGGEQQAASSEQ